MRPYDGEFGIFEICSDRRLLRSKSAHGSLWSRDVAVAVGAELEGGLPNPTQSCILPIGDYMPALMTINYGPMLVVISENYHSDGKPRDRGGRPQIYGIKIRKDKPFILDFSNRPEVMFASPAKDCRLKPGEQLNINAVLIDPKLDIMIRDLKGNPGSEVSPLPIIVAVVVLFGLGVFWLSSRQLRRRYRLLLILSLGGVILIIAGFSVLWAVASQLDYEDIEPQVVISRATGEIITRGTMPFG